MGIFPILQTSISHRKPGVRRAACHCVRALSRTVAAVKTSLVDSGLGRNVIEVGLGITLNDDKGDAVTTTKKPARADGQSEDRRVVNAALAAICNLVADGAPLRSVRDQSAESSPLRFIKLVQVILEKNALDQLVGILRGEEPSLRLNALWTIKNLLCNASVDAKRSVTEAIGWETLTQ
jgi:armadillo repeat-containing protein 8